jgi:hypothetical protein
LISGEGEGVDVIGSFLGEVTGYAGNFFVRKGFGIIATLITNGGQ